MKRGIFLIAALALAGCGGGEGRIELGEEGRLMRDMAEIVGIFASANPSFRWTDLHHRIAYDLKQGKSPKDIAVALFDEEKELNRLLNKRIYLPITRVFSDDTYAMEDGDREIALVSCSWVLKDELNRKVDSLLQKNKYEAIEYMQKGLARYVAHVLSSGDSLAPLKAERAAMAYSCFHAMAEAFGKVKPGGSLGLVYWHIAQNRPDIVKRIEEYGTTEGGDDLDSGRGL